MFYQSGGRSTQRLKGFKIKRAFQVGLLLAVCIWLLYQVNHHSDDNKKKKNYGATEERIRITKEYKTLDFGRKGNVGGSNDEVETISEDTNGIEEGDQNKEDRGDGDDDELDRNSRQEKAEEKESEIVTPDHDKDNAEENVVNLEEKSEENDSNRQENDAIDNNEEKKVANDEEKRNEKVMTIRQQEEPSGSDKDNFDTQDGHKALNSDSERDFKDNADDEMAMSMSPPKREETSSKEAENGVDGFEDVNGVPHDGLELVNSSPFEKMGEENNTSLDHPGEAAGRFRLI